MRFKGHLCKAIFQSHWFCQLCYISLSYIICFGLWKYFQFLILYSRHELWLSTLCSLEKYSFLNYFNSYFFSFFFWTQPIFFKTQPTESVRIPVVTNNNLLSVMEMSSVNYSSITAALYNHAVMEHKFLLACFLPLLPVCTHILSDLKT